ncbi:hypothetical protein HU200_065028 [Digitaria exilis]|uniref:Uncharacterized protein n=1 Tax=Digitaria exilis TaxID=1010633 RepID=A0A835A4D2_9POAL|nr:hypothetical protein HU200_065028 [Digitaria exilis]
MADCRRLKGVPPVSDSLDEGHSCAVLAPAACAVWLHLKAGAAGSFDRRTPCLPACAPSSPAAPQLHSFITNLPLVIVPTGVCLVIPTFDLWADMGKLAKLAKLVDGIKDKLAGGGGGNRTAAVCYDKVDKTDSMRVEIRSRRARQLIAKNLAVADDIAGGTSSSPRGAGGKKKTNKKKRFFGF